MILFRKHPAYARLPLTTCALAGLIMGPSIAMATWFASCGCWVLARALAAIAVGALAIAVLTVVQMMRAWPA